MSSENEKKIDILAIVLTVLILVTFIASAAIFILIIPHYKKAYADMSVALPGVTVLAIQASDNFRNYWFMVAPLFLVAIAAPFSFGRFLRYSFQITVLSFLLLALGSYFAIRFPVTHTFSTEQKLAWDYHWDIDFKRDHKKSEEKLLTVIRKNFKEHKKPFSDEKTPKFFFTKVLHLLEKSNIPEVVPFYEKEIVDIYKEVNVKDYLDWYFSNHLSAILKSLNTIDDKAELKSLQKTIAPNDKLLIVAAVVLASQKQDLGFVLLAHMEQEMYLQLFTDWVPEENVDFLASWKKWKQKGKFKKYLHRSLFENMPKNIKIDANVVAKLLTQTRKK